MQNGSLLPQGYFEESSLPDQTGNAGRFLETDGTNAFWASIIANGTLSGSPGQVGFFTTIDNVGSDPALAWDNTLKILTAQNATVTDVLVSPPLSNVFYVDGGFTGTTSTGSINSPFTTIQDAINATGTEGTWTIICTTPTEYTESLTLPVNTDSYRLTIMSESLNAVSEIDGDITWIAGTSGSLECTIKNMRIEGNITLNSNGFNPEFTFKLVSDPTELAFDYNVTYEGTIDATAVTDNSQFVFSNVFAYVPDFNCPTFEVAMNDSFLESGTDFICREVYGKNTLIDELFFIVSNTSFLGFQNCTMFDCNWTGPGDMAADKYSFATFIENGFGIPLTNAVWIPTGLGAQGAKQFFFNPVAADFTSLMANQTIVDGDTIFNGLFTQTDCPRLVNLDWVDAGGLVSAGTLTIDYADQNGNQRTDIFSLTAGSQTFVTTYPVDFIQTATVTGVVGTDGTQTLSMGPNNGLGLPTDALVSLYAGTSGLQNTSYTPVLRADNEREAPVILDQDLGFIQPTTNPDGATSYFVSYQFRT